MADPMIVSAILQNEAGLTASAPVYLESGTPSADALAYATLYASAIDKVTDAQVVGATVTLNAGLPSGIKTAPIVGTDLARRGLLTFYIPGFTYVQSTNVPAINIASMDLVTKDGLKTTVNPLLAYIDFLKQQIVNLNPIAITDSKGNPIGNLKRGKRVNRRH